MLQINIKLQLNKSILRDTSLEHELIKKVTSKYVNIKRFINNKCIQIISSK